MMKAYYVIWRWLSDDFYITRLDLDPECASRLGNQQWVQMAYDAENPEEDNPFVGDDPETYDLIDVFSGDNVEFHAK
nr:MAG TPA: hypothetical protein [Caudoviricetes sp.]